MTRSFPVISLWLATAATITAMDQIIVSPHDVLRTFTRNPVGINVNHLMDADVNRPPGTRPLSAALADLGVGMLRFPEGELGDGYLWAVPPFPARSADAPQWALRGPGVWPCKDPRFSTADGQPRPTVMGFDSFMAVAGMISAEPVLIVAYDSAFKDVTPGNQRPTVEQLRISAVEWVRYANRTNGWNVRYWEIGNETDISPLAHSGGDPGAARYAADVIEFSAAMKAVDPTIRIGLNIWRIDRWKALLAIPELGAAVDYVSLHNYPSYGWTDGYDRFRTGRPDLVSHLREAEALLATSTWAPADRARLEFLVTETNVVDWSKQPWPNVADLGHALVAVDLIGQTLSMARVSSLEFWVTRWIHNDADQPREVFDALDRTNHLTPIGQAIGLWGRTIGTSLVAVRSSTPEVIAYASTTPDTGRLALILLNRTSTVRPVRVQIEGHTRPAQIAVEQLAGDTPAALTATLERSALTGTGDGTWTVSLPAFSATALTLSAAP